MRQHIFGVVALLVVVGFATGARAATPDALGVQATATSRRAPLGVGVKMSSATQRPGADLIVPLGAHVVIDVFGTALADHGWAVTPTVEIRRDPGRVATTFVFTGPRFERRDADHFGFVVGLGHEWQVAPLATLVATLGVDYLDRELLPLGELGMRLTF